MFVWSLLLWLFVQLSLTNPFCNIYSTLTEISEFQRLSESLVDVLSTQSASIENYKNLAIGVRNKSVQEVEARKSKQLELQQVALTKRQELDRLRAELESLKRVEAEQNATLEKVF